MQSEFYHAARHTAAVLRTPWYGGIVRLTGPDRVSWLQGMVTNDVGKLLPGDGAYAAHLNAQGKLIGQMTILVDSTAIWLALETSNVKKLLGALEPMIVMEDVLAEDQTGLLESIGVLGPSAHSVLETWVGERFELDNEYQHLQFPKGCRIVRDAMGYTVLGTSEQIESMLQGIIAAGAQPIDEPTWNVLRIEAGLPLYGIDIDDSTTLPELGEKGISYDKGCYIGQEVVARVKYIGHVNRRFMGFVCDGETVPEPRSPVLRQEQGDKGGREVGYITSSIASPGIGKPIALGFVNRSSAVAGAQVALSAGGKKIAATVSDLPFQLLNLPVNSSAD